MKSKKLITAFAALSIVIGCSNALSAMNNSSEKNYNNAFELNIEACAAGNDDPEYYKHIYSEDDTDSSAVDKPVIMSIASGSESVKYTNGTLIHAAKFNGAEKDWGVDVSYYQGNINWSKVKADGIDFAIIRVGYRGYGTTGQLVVDEKFKENIEAAKKAGLKVGVYFYTQAINEKEAREEADFVYKNIKGYDLDLPVYYDIESVDYDVGRLDSAGLSKAQKTDLCKAFCDRMISYGYDAGVYSNPTWLMNYINGPALGKEYPIWLANYNSYATYFDNYEVWQFSSKGKVNGISSNVDMNVLYSLPVSIQSVSDFDVSLSNSSAYYTGNAIKPEVVVKSNGKTLVNNKDYTLTYSNNVNVGKGKITVTGKGSYTGSKTVTFNIFPAKPTGLSGTKYTDRLIIKWNKVESADGYRVYRYNESTKEWDYVKNITDNNTTAITNINLVPGKKYQYRVRSYKKVGTQTFVASPMQINISTLKMPTMSGFKAVPSSNSIKLNWDKKSGIDGYKLYRYDEKAKGYVLLKTFTASNYVGCTNSSLKADTDYKYKIRTYKVIKGTTYYGTSASVSSRTLKQATTPVAINGQLRVDGANIVNSRGETFQIRGMSTHGIMWEDFSNILSKDSLKVFRDDWGVNTVRIAMYTEEWGGYTTGVEFAKQAKEKVYNGVDNATDLGMYVIIDWHIMNQDGNPQKHQSEAIDFFNEVSNKYKNYNNVIYEICNEPNNSTGTVTWSANIKPYAEQVISTIRKNDNDALIIVGTGTWCQDIDQAEKDRLSDKNTVYALHFYANTHTDWLRNRLVDCYNKGLPILVSEFGTCDASGNGGFNRAQTETWLNLLDSKNIGYINWSACGKSETASAFKSGTDLSRISAGESQLTESGKLIRELYRKRAAL